MSAIKVGDRYTVERRWCGHLQHSNVMTVTKVTSKRAYFGGSYFSIVDTPPCVVLPRYSDTTTTATPLEIKS